MRTRLALAGLAAASFLFLNSCNNDNTEAPKKYVTGMLFEKRERLAGIPLASTPLGGTELPSSIDWSDKMPEVGDQGTQQSCVAWAVAYALKGYQEDVELDEKLEFSPSYIYNQINHGENAPTLVVDALNTLSDQGVCLMDEMPYKNSDWRSKPSEEARASAKRFRIDYWRQVNTQDIKEVKAQLAAGLPVVIGATISQEFMNDGQRLKEDYIWKEAGTIVGGHAMLVVGYDDEKHAFKLMNSWGKGWGDHGFGWVDYTLFPEVVPYGFVAKDAYTEPSTVKKGPKKGKEEDFDTTTHYTEELNPRDNPVAFDTIDFHEKEVVHNVRIESDMNSGPAMKISGTLDLPARFGKQFQVAVHIYDAQTGQQVKSLMYPEYADVNGFAAKATPAYDIGKDGFRQGTWWINIPYRAIDFPKGKSYFYAIPTLFVDNFGVAYGDKINFWVEK